MKDQGGRMRDQGEGESDEGGEIGFDLDPDPQKILWIRIRLNDADPVDPDPQHWFKVCKTIMPCKTHVTRQLL